MRQRQRAVGTGQVVLMNLRHDKLLLIEELMKKSRAKQYTNFTRTQYTHNRWTLSADVSYGPVWGCWESDIRGQLLAFAARVGSMPRITVNNWKRDVRETRGAEHRA